MSLASPEEIAWAAGLFEGEGCIKIRQDWNNVGLSLGMTDGDSVQRFGRIVGVGAVRTRNREAESFQPHWKTQYVWTVHDQEEVSRILTMFLPWFSERRRARALEAFERLARNHGRGETRTHCKRGHPLSDDNVYVRATTGWRNCKTCHRDREREKYRAGRAA